ncbi:MAG: hypothetical protein AB8I08_08845 [Sandaracinaceae bacterium]
MSVGPRSSKKKSPRASKVAKKASSASAKSRNGTAKKATSKKKAAPKRAAKKAAPKKAAKKAAPKKAAKKAAPKKAAPKKAAKKAAPKKAAKKAAPKKAAPKKKGGGELLPPVEVRRSREDKAWAEARLAEIDQVMSAWADILAERMVADQTFSEIVEQLQVDRPRDLQGLFLWEALHAAESHVALITEVIALHMSDRKADPVAILDDLRSRRRRVAAVYAVNAFLAVLNQMKPTKAKWLSSMDAIDPRFAVLALAHQTLRYATDAVKAEGPPDLTDMIISATQDEAVWVWRRMPEPGTDTLAACAAAAAFFRQLDADVLVTTDEVAAHYAAHSRA